MADRCVVPENRTIASGDSSILLGARPVGFDSFQTVALYSVAAFVFGLVERVVSLGDCRTEAATGTDQRDSKARSDLKSCVSAVEYFRLYSGSETLRDGMGLAWRNLIQQNYELFSAPSSNPVKWSAELGISDC